MKLILSIALLVVPILVHAEITPAKGKFDPRVRVVDYNPLNVTKLSTFYGVSTHVQFERTETIVDIAAGDDQAWHLIKSHLNNSLYIKPKATKADTNLTVVTDKRTYNFVLVVQARPIKDSEAWADHNLIYSLTFRYPEDEAAKSTANAEKDTVKTRLNEFKTLPNEPKENQNYNYWVAGDEEISPTAARDDGRYIFLTFSNNRDMPAVYSVDAAGNEALINTNVINSNTIVIQRLVNHLMLRKGGSVASVINKSFNMNGGIDNSTGTVAPTVERVIKGGS